MAWNRKHAWRAGFVEEIPAAPSGARPMLSDDRGLTPPGYYRAGPPGQSRGHPRKIAKSQQILTICLPWNNFRCSHSMLGQLTACRLGPSASPHMKIFSAVSDFRCGKHSTPYLPASLCRDFKPRPARAEPSARPVSSGEVFRVSEPVFTRRISWNMRRGASRTVQNSLRFAGTSTTRGALTGSLHVPKNTLPCMTISAPTAARVPAGRGIAATAAGATLPTPAPQTARRHL